MRALMSILSLLLVAACANVPLATPESDTEGRAFRDPAPGKGALYVYRESINGSGVVVVTSLDGRTLATFGPDTWVRVDLDPGDHKIMCMGETTPEIRVPLTAHETRYVEVAMRPGWTAARCAVFEVPVEQGRKAVLTGRRAAQLF